jgi:8-oxo-dGTP pyrophosphatase MutT (NUDIX family)
MQNKGLRPRDAATLVLLRRAGGAWDVLMGRRHRRQAFMPEVYVFPGGVVERGDALVAPARPLRSDVATRLQRSCPPARARGLAAAAIRETFEETGLMVAAPTKPRTGSAPANWRAFCTDGLAPDLGCLDYIYRAVTPPRQPRRFNARFFMAQPENIRGSISGDGELTDVGWVPLKEAADLPIPHITGVVLHRVAQLLARPARRDADEPVPICHFARGEHVFDTE